MKRFGKENAYITLAIFLIVLVQLTSIPIAWFGEPATFISHGDHYLLFWYPLRNNLVEIVVSVFFVLWARRVKACVYTWVSALVYFAMSIISLAETLFNFNYVVYIITLVALSSIIVTGTLILGVIRLCLQRFGKRLL